MQDTLACLDLVFLEYGFNTKSIFIKMILYQLEGSKKETYFDQD